MAIRASCPHPDCLQHYKVEESNLGRNFTCKRCGRSFVLQATGQSTIGPSPESQTGGRVATAADVPGKIGRFEIQGRLGAGAFGAVYRAHDPVLQRKVALKVPRAAVLERPEAKARFLREPKAAAQLRHPHIVPIFDAGSDGEQFYIASAYIEGKTLEETIAHRRSRFSRCRGHGPRSGRGVALRARHGRGPSRREAGQRHDRRQGRSPADGFRSGTPGERRREAHARRQRDGYAGLHGAGTGRRIVRHGRPG